jgi:hypothetical protein
MQRRRFLRLTGLSTAALFFDRTNAFAGAPQYAPYSPSPTNPRGRQLTLHFPDAISVLKAGQWTPLTGSKEHWTLDSLRLDLRHTQNGIAIDVQSPVTALEKLRLSWPWSFPAGAIALGDAWERSYGDLSWQNVNTVRQCPWYLLVHDGRQTHGFGIKTGAAAFCHWEANIDSLNLVLDMCSGGMGVHLGDRLLKATEIVTTQSEPGETPFQTDARFCRLMCDKPRLPEKPVYGINDWYFAYGHNSRELILETTKTMAALATDTGNPPFSVIDDGWETDDFTISNERFGDMSVVAAGIKATGMRPGLWTRPLLANTNSNPANLIQRPGNDSREHYLDPTIPENLQKIAATIRRYKEWGFQLVKHDYSTYDALGRWGSQMQQEITASGWHFNDRSRTNAEIFLELYNTIRTAAADMYLIGCNTVSHLSAGIFELNRIGDDTSGKEWARVPKMGVNTLAFRLPQHNAFYAADGDCVGVTPYIPWEKNRQWMQLLAESGAPLFISAQPEATGVAQRTYIKECFTRAARPQPTGQPLDWITNPHPERWLLNNRQVTFDW